MIITTGDHGRNLNTSPGVYAHQYMPTDADGDNPQGHERQAWNFVTYANALGGCTGIVLLHPPAPSDVSDREHAQVEMCDWAKIVTGAMGLKVEIR